MKDIVLTVCLLAIAGCGTKMQTPFTNYHPFYGRVFDPEVTLDQVEMSQASAWKTAHSAAHGTTPPDTQALTSYVGNGLTFSRLVCRDYFERIAFSRAHREFARKEVSLAGGLVSALMGLADANSGAIAAVGAAFGFGGASFDAYQESYLVSPDVANLEALVMTEQDKLEREIMARLSSSNDNKIDTVYEADSVLNSFIFACTPNGIRKLLNDSINTSIEEKQAP